MKINNKTVKEMRYSELYDISEIIRTEMNMRIEKVLRQGDGAMR